MSIAFAKELRSYGKVKTDQLLSKWTTFKIGGAAHYIVSVSETDKIVPLIQFLEQEQVEYMILGGGSNMLVADEGFEGVIIHLKNEQFEVDGDVLVAEAGCATVAMAQESIKAGLTGFEWGVGVPGTIGGAVRGNAGAMGGEMKDCVQQVEVYLEGEVVRLGNEQCEFGYRHSAFKENEGVILRVWLKLEKSENKAGMKQALEHLQYRNKTQPQGWASTGCIFKNYQVAAGGDLEQILDSKFDIPKQFFDRGLISAGWLIDQAGMKGEQVGQAQVSEAHGNFIVNLGDATAADVRALIERVKQAVYDKFGIELEEEIQTV